jgi:NADPH:quinone reductase
MRAVVYTRTGGPEVLRVVERPVPDPGPGEVRVQVAVSGVNPTDWKVRTGPQPLAFAEQVPNQDGSGTIDAVGEGVDPDRVGQRVWLWEAAWKRAGGTAQEYVVLPERQAVALPGIASFDLGASLGVPALTAHRALTVTEGGPDHLAPGILAGRAVLVAGGAGAVGHAAIELARWAGATVVSTVSSPRKAELARAAGAHHVVDYRGDDPAAAVLAFAPGGVDLVVEVNPVANLALNSDVLAPAGTVAIYAHTPARPDLTVPIRLTMTANTRLQFILLYTVPTTAKSRAVDDVSAAVAAGALRVGADAGLPLHRYPLAETATAHKAVEDGAVGKVLIDVAAH